MNAIMSILSENRGFYPTPAELGQRMQSKIKGNGLTALEPSAGKADLIDAINKPVWDEDIRFYTKGIVKTFHCIEKDPDLQAILRGKGHTVIDSDFLTFSGPDKYDLIIANPPFADGHKHLLKAIDIMYSGQIIFLLNAETIRNPFSNSRKLLVKKLTELNADIEYIQGAFADAERPTGVEVALIDLTITRDVKQDLFAGADDRTEDFSDEFKESYEVSNGRTISEMVADYNNVLAKSMDVIFAYYKNYRKVSRYVALNEELSTTHLYSGIREETKNLTKLMQKSTNNTAERIRLAYWNKTLSLKEVTNRLTAKKQREFEEALKTYSNMDFTENNIRTFVLNLIGGYEQTIKDSISALFEEMTNYAYRANQLYLDNIHYFNGWKTNDAFRVGKKVILPVHVGWGSPWLESSGRWRLDHSAERYLRDFDLVMNYFDGGKPGYVSIADALKNAFHLGQNRKIDSNYFEISVFKKGTIHLTFKDMDILRRFNVVACKEKSWLPDDYNETPFQEMSPEVQEVVKSFEGEESYKKNYRQPLITAGTANNLRLAA